MGSGKGIEKNKHVGGGGDEFSKREIVNPETLLKSYCRFVKSFIQNWRVSRHLVVESRCWSKLITNAFTFSSPNVHSCILSIHGNDKRV